MGRKLKGISEQRARAAALVDDLHLWLEVNHGSEDMAVIISALMYSTGRAIAFLYRDDPAAATAMIDDFGVILREQVEVLTTKG